MMTTAGIPYVKRRDDEMRVCIVAEGCYPYVTGGVSGWINSMIKSFPDIDFVVLAIIANRSMSGKFVYELPQNVSAVYEAYLDDKNYDKPSRNRKIKRMGEREYSALRSIVLNYKVDWECLFEYISSPGVSVDEILMGPDFYDIVKELYYRDYYYVVFSDFLWTLRSIYLPLLLCMKTEIPKADLYHCVATGYAGVLGSMAKHFYGSKLLVSEHGIYTREREEELLKASWVKGVYKNIWIDQFKKMSHLAYRDAGIVTCLFGHAKRLQTELGCDPRKIWITPNGIDVDGFAAVPGKQPEDEGWINIGAVLRVTPIKDVKTMIRAFAYAKQRYSRLKLWIMGPMEEDETYAKECVELVDVLNVKDVIFTGRINTKEYIGRMDVTILTSISEGQPLTILESYAAHVPVIATDVGNCSGLIFGEEGDEFGEAGILTHIMNVEEIADAMVRMAEDKNMRLTMGENGYRRADSYYRLEDMKKKYTQIYRLFGY